MIVYFAADHAGFELKQTLLKYVRDELNYTVEDCGAHTYAPDDDYPILIRKAALAVAGDPEAKAIILGGSGEGEAIEANRHSGVRAAVYYGGNPKILSLSREHNNANVLSLGARFLSSEEAQSAVKLWLLTEFSNEERHQRRITMLDTK
jgi:ribose 5-phosphate isomerase B